MARRYGPRRRGNPCPVLAVSGALADPLAKFRNLGRLQGPPALFRWHALLRVVVFDPLHQFALLRFPRHDGSIPSQVTGGSLEGVESKLCLAFLAVESVTMEALVREDRANLEIEINLRRSSKPRQRQTKNNAFSKPAH